MATNGQIDGIEIDKLREFAASIGLKLDIYPAIGPGRHGDRRIIIGTRDGDCMGTTLFEGVRFRRLGTQAALDARIKAAGFLAERAGDRED
jgi:hypothetical protein